MAFLADHTAHAPPVPSPLNPTAPRRRKSSAIFYRGRTAMSLSERLLRRKAAEAWRTESLHRQAAQHEQLATEAAVVAKVVVLHIVRGEGGAAADRIKTTAARYSLCPLEARRAVPESESGRTDPGHLARTYLVQLKDLGFGAPRRVFKALRVWSAFSPWRLHDFLRGSLTSVR